MKNKLSKYADGQLESFANASVLADLKCTQKEQNKARLSTKKRRLTWALSLASSALVVAIVLTCVFAVPRDTDSSNGEISISEMQISVAELNKELLYSNFVDSNDYETVVSRFVLEDSGNTMFYFVSYLYTDETTRIDFAVTSNETYKQLRESGVGIGNKSQIISDETYQKFFAEKEYDKQDTVAGNMLNYVERNVDEAGTLKTIVYGRLKIQQETIYIVYETISKNQSNNIVEVLNTLIVKKS